MKIEEEINNIIINEGYTRENINMCNIWSLTNNIGKLLEKQDKNEELKEEIKTLAKSMGKFMGKIEMNFADHYRLYHPPTKKTQMSVPEYTILEEGFEEAGNRYRLLKVTFNNQQGSDKDIIKEREELKEKLQNQPNNTIVFTGTIDMLKEEIEQLKKELEIWKDKSFLNGSYLKKNKQSKPPKVSSSDKSKEAEPEDWCILAGQICFMKQELRVENKFKDNNYFELKKKLSEMEKQHERCKEVFTETDEKLNELIKEKEQLNNKILKREKEVREAEALVVTLGKESVEFREKSEELQKEIEARDYDLGKITKLENKIEKAIPLLNSAIDLTDTGSNQYKNILRDYVRKIKKILEKKV